MIFYIINTNDIKNSSSITDKNSYSIHFICYIRQNTLFVTFHLVRRENLPGKQLLATNEKYYITDHGIRESIYGNNQRDIQLILENIVYIELLRRGYNVTVRKVD